MVYSLHLGLGNFHGLVITEHSGFVFMSAGTYIQRHWWYNLLTWKQWYGVMKENLFHIKLQAENGGLYNAHSILYFFEYNQDHCLIKAVLINSAIYIWRTI